VSDAYTPTEIKNLIDDVAKIIEAGQYDDVTQTAAQAVAKVFWLRYDSPGFHFKGFTDDDINEILDQIETDYGYVRWDKVGTNVAGTFGGFRRVGRRYPKIYGVVSSESGEVLVTLPNDLREKLHGVSGKNVRITFTGRGLNRQKVFEVTS
jgi:hypothetical protein